MLSIYNFFVKAPSRLMQILRHLSTVKLIFIFYYMILIIVFIFTHSDTIPFVMDDHHSMTCNVVGGDILNYTPSDSNPPEPMSQAICIFYILGHWMKSHIVSNGVKKK